jgi:hypothetical protein
MSDVQCPVADNILFQLRLPPCDEIDLTVLVGEECQERFEARGIGRSCRSGGTG